MISTTNKNYIPRGDLMARASLLGARMEKREYRPETVLSMDQAGWPGDWEGRTILALVRLAETTKKEPAYLHEIVDVVLEARNARGYLGPIYDDGIANEQQLSGHSWLLRGLCAYYGYTGKQEIYDAALTIGQNLFLPLYDTYLSYPVAPEDRVYAGDMAGNAVKTVGKWIISTDTGCAYIPLDGMSALYEMTGDAEIGRMLDRIISLFTEIDFTGICVQTHATLTGTRGILRTYRMRRDPAYLAAAEKLFAMYTEHGMTANYANYNWFGRPLWTEPCAVIDSFMCAMQLYTETGRRDYLTTAQRIYYNGIGFGQRENGGFGCDTCVGALGIENNTVIRLHCEEAYWCCSMRGGEGLASVAEYAYLPDPAHNTVTIPYFSSSDAALTLADGRLSLSQLYKCGDAEAVCMTVTENTVKNPVTLICYLPDTAEALSVSGAEYKVENKMLHLTVTEATKEINITYTLPLTKEAPVGEHNRKDMWVILRGNRMYSVTTDEMLSVTADDILAGNTDVQLRPLYDAYETDHAPRQVLFS